MRAQVGIEVVGVVGFAFLILIPLFAGFYLYSNEYWERLAIERADNAAGSMAGMVDMVGVQGEGMLVQEIVIPDNVDSITVRGNEVALSLSTSWGKTEIVKGTAHEASWSAGNLGPGSYLVRAEAKGGRVTLELD